MVKVSPHCLVRLPPADRPSAADRPRLETAPFIINWAIPACPCLPRPPSWRCGLPIAILVPAAWGAAHRSMSNHSLPSAPVGPLLDPHSSSPPSVTGFLQHLHTLPVHSHRPPPPPVPPHQSVLDPPATPPGSGRLSTHRHPCLSLSSLCPPVLMCGYSSTCGRWRSEPDASRVHLLA